MIRSSFCNFEIYDMFPEDSIETNFEGMKIKELEFIRSNVNTRNNCNLLDNTMNLKK